MKPAGWARLTGSGLVVSGPVALHSLYIRGAAANQTATFYDGEDAFAGRQIMTLSSDASYSAQKSFVPPVRLGSGLYVAFGTGIIEVFVSYDALWDMPLPDV